MPTDGEYEVIGEFAITPSIEDVKFILAKLEELEGSLEKYS